MNRIPSLSLVLLVASATALAAACNRHDEPTSAGTPAVTTDATTSSAMSAASTVTPDAALAPASAASQ